MFELKETTRAKLHDVIVLSSKNRKPEDNPGAKLPIALTLPNSVLDVFAAGLRAMLFDKAAAGSQEQLQGVDAVSDLPALSAIGAKIGAFPWKLELTGYCLTFIFGTGRKASNIEIQDCALSGFRFTAKEGGSVDVKFNVESEHVTAEQFGRLAMLKSREVEITLAAPELRQEDLAGQ